MNEQSNTNINFQDFIEYCDLNFVLLEYLFYFILDFRLICRNNSSNMKYMVAKLCC